MFSWENGFWVLNMNLLMKLIVEQDIDILGILFTI